MILFTFKVLSERIYCIIAVIQKRVLGVHEKVVYQNRVIIGYGNQYDYLFTIQLKLIFRFQGCFAIKI